MVCEYKNANATNHHNLQSDIAYETQAVEQARLNKLKLDSKF